VLRNYAEQIRKQRFHSGIADKMDTMMNYLIMKDKTIVIHKAVAKIVNYHIRMEVAFYLKFKKSKQSDKMMVLTFTSAFFIVFIM
jgi:hypothetical protein